MQSDWNKAVAPRLRMLAKNQGRRGPTPAENENESGIYLRKWPTDNITGNHEQHVGEI